MPDGALLSQRIAHTADLMRTRVNLSLEAQNQRLLASMEERSRLQLRLQQTVEGLSVVAITCCALGLLSYLQKGAKELGLPVGEAALALAVPLVAVGVFLAVRRIRRALERRG